MNKKIIGLVGLKPKQIYYLNNRYKKLNFVNINDNNFFDKKSFHISALIILYEYPVKKNLSLFLKKNFKNFRKLEWLHLTRAGVDECEPYMKNYKFKFTAGKKIQGPNVSEHCLAMLLSLTRGLFDQYNFDKYSFRPTEIKNKKIVVAGLGGIGREIAKKLNQFTSHISSIDHSKISSKYIKKNYSLKLVPKIIKNYDILINALPLTKKTKYFFDKKVFRNMKKNSIFVSVSRDQTVNVKDLKFFLKKNKFLGVAIDNTGSFKMKKKITYNRRFNFLITDHLAGVTTDNKRRLELVLDNIKSYSSGKKLNFEVSKLKGY